MKLIYLVPGWCWLLVCMCVCEGMLETELLSSHLWWLLESCAGFITIITLWSFQDLYHRCYLWCNTQWRLGSPLPVYWLQPGLLLWHEDSAHVAAPCPGGGIGTCPLSLCCRCHRVALWAPAVPATWPHFTTQHLPNSPECWPTYRALGSG